METGARLVIADGFSRELEKLFAGIDKAEKSLVSFQAKLEKLNMGISVKTITGEIDEIVNASRKGADKIALNFAGMNDKVADGFAGMTGAAGKAMTEIVDASKGETGKVLANFSALQKDVDAEFVTMKTAAGEHFASIAESSRVSSAAMTANYTKAIEEIAAASRAAGAAAGGPILPGAGPMRPHGVGPRAPHGGIHLRGEGVKLPGGGHLGMSGDGLVPAVAGFGLIEMVKHATEDAMEFRHWDSLFKASSFSNGEVNKAEAAAWANAKRQPGTTASESLKSVFEMIKVFPKAGEKGPSVDEALEMLPGFTDVMVGLRSVKAEGLHSKFADGRQIYDLAKGLEETGVTQRGATPEERAANTQHMINELFKTMLSERGVTDGSSFYALTNNSKGASQNWDERMATVVAPILGSVMKASKMGNADYMVLKTFQAGRADSKTVEGLVNAGLLDEDVKSGAAWQDKKHQWHLDANNKFSEGADKNLWDWSARQLEVLKAHGVNVNEQEQVNAKINQIGANASTTTLLRALLEPATRSMVAKDMYARDQIKDDALQKLESNDPVLKLNAFGNSLNNLFTALGTGLVDPALDSLTKITAGINSFAQAMHDNPNATKYGAEAAGVAGVGLLGYGGGKMLGLFGGANAELTKAALMLQEAAIANGAKGVPGSPADKGGKGPGSNLIGGILSGFIYEYGKAAIDRVLGWTPENQKTLDHATSFPNVWKDVKEQWFGGGGASPALGTDGNALHRWDEMPAGLKKTSDAADAAGLKLGSLSDKTGIVLTSWDGIVQSGTALTSQSGSLDNAFKIVEMTAMGAARALATVAMGGGGMGGGSGFINASWGGGGGAGGSWNGNALGVSGGFGNAGWEKSGASRPEVADYIKAQAAKLGIDPNVALRVSQSEGFNTYTGDYGTSFGPFQLHYGGSGIRGMNSGGLGDAFTRATGLNARDPSTWKAQVDFALRQAKQGGWGPWHGAQHVGIGNRQGLDWHGPVPTASAPPRKVTPGAPANANGGAHIEAAVSRALSGHKLEVAVVYDEKHKQHVAQFVTKRQASAMRFPRDMGGPDAHGTFVSPGTPVTDPA